MSKAAKRNSTLSNGSRAEAAAHEEAAEALPPAYSGPSTQQTVALPNQSLIPGIPRLPFHQYAPKGSSLSKDSTTVTVNDPKLALSLHDFLSFIKQQTSLPPRPSIRIRGTHQNWSATEVDFDFQLSLMPYITPPTSSAGATAPLNYVRLPPDAKDLTGLARAFLTDQKAARKHFRIARRVTNLDAAYLAGCVHTLLAALNYRGKAQVTFPAAHAAVVVDVEPRGIVSAFRGLFATPKVYEVESVWPFASAPPPSSADGDGASAAGAGRRECLVRSEQGWWADWRGVVRDCVLKRKTVKWVGVEDWIEAAMEPAPVGPEVAPEPWGMDKR